VKEVLTVTLVSITLYLLCYLTALAAAWAVATLIAGGMQL
jgi:hypothetical protein